MAPLARLFRRSTAPAAARGERSDKDERLSGMLSSHYNVVWRSARRHGLDAARAEDIAQKAFIVASQKLDQIDDGRELGFLLGVTARLCSDERKSAFHRRAIYAPALLDQLVDPRMRPDQALLDREARELLDRALAELPDNLRTVFVLANVEGVTMADIAVALELPPGTIASRLRRARELLRDTLSGWLDEPGAPCFERLQEAGGAK